MSELVAESLPPETIAAVRAELGPLADGIIAAVRAASPIYGEVFGSPEGMALRLGVEQAIRAFLDAVERGERVRGIESETDEIVADARARPSTRPAGASRICARPFAAASGQRGGGPPRWRPEPASRRRRRSRSPRRSSSTATSWPPTSSRATCASSQTRPASASGAGAGWPPLCSIPPVRTPTRWRVPPSSRNGRCRERWQWWPSGAMTRRRWPAAWTSTCSLGSDGDGAWLVLPDPDAPGRRAAVDRALAAQPAALGPTVAVADAHRSLRWARLALEVVARARRPGPARRRSPARSHPAPGSRARRRSSPGRACAALDVLPAGERERLTETLAAWLAHQRHTPAIAEELHVHPQTVRYRIAKLRELLGDAMDTGEGRFELMLALRISAMAPAG